MKVLLLTTAAALAGVDEAPTAVAPTAGDKTIAAPSDETGVIVGKVVFEGTRPDPKPDLSIGEKESEGCKHHGDGVAKVVAFVRE